MNKVFMPGQGVFVDNKYKAFADKGVGPTEDRGEGVGGLVI